MAQPYTLYVRTGCPFCGRVLAEGERLGIPFEVKNIRNPLVTMELMKKGGKRQVPFLIDHEQNVSLFESDKIIAYLHERYSSS